MEIGNKKNHSRHLSVFVLICIYALTVFLFSKPACAAESILLLRIRGEDFEQAAKAMTRELEEELIINEMIVSRSTTTREVHRKMAQVSPRLVVLMDNIAISLYKKYQGISGNTVPCVSLMASFTDISIRGMKNATGIFYEVPLVTSVVNLRSIMPAVKIRRIGTVSRRILKPFIRVNRAYCKKEEVELVAYFIPNKGDIKTELKKRLRRLARDESIDAIWVVTDSMLINTRLFKEVWLPFAEDFEKLIIVGAEVLADPRFQFGTFGVVPDHAGLGIQAAEMIYDIMETGWRVNEGTVEQPQSVFKILNFRQAKKRFHVKEEQLKFVHKVLR